MVAPTSGCPAAVRCQMLPTRWKAACISRSAATNHATLTHHWVLGSQPLHESCRVGVFQELSGAIQLGLSGDWLQTMRSATITVTATIAYCWKSGSCDLPDLIKLLTHRRPHGQVTGGAGQPCLRA